MIQHNKLFILLMVTLITVGMSQTPEALAATGAEIDASAKTSLQRLKDNVPGADKLIKKANGVLVFPSVIKAGIGIGGQYGEGVLQINGKPVDYYSIAGASIGFQLGGQAQTVILLFMDNEELKHFRNSKGWKAGVDGSVALITLDAGAAIDTESIEEPILAFVLNRRGLMYNLTIEGSKFTKIKRNF